ncbi:hypothetical protein BJV78DRAFT_1219353 [Lactifluus subvellereus]|nr:hypothetical protein BJV78DRAFT_1219353 [Lactifluus subvellereus]
MGASAGPGVKREFEGMRLAIYRFIRLGRSLKLLQHSVSESKPRVPPHSYHAGVHEYNTNRISKVRPTNCVTSPLEVLILLSSHIGIALKTSWMQLLPSQRVTACQTVWPRVAAEAIKTLSDFLEKRSIVSARRLFLFEGISAAAVATISFGPTCHRHSNGI